MVVKNVLGLTPLKKVVMFKNAQVTTKYFKSGISCYCNRRDFPPVNITQNVLLVDCRWSDWRLGDCSVSCGDGVRENTRFKEQGELFGGAPCEGVVSHTEACINRICPGMLLKH